MRKNFNFIQGRHSKKLYERCLYTGNISYVFGIEPTPANHFRNWQVPEKKSAIRARWIGPHYESRLCEVVSPLDLQEDLRRHSEYVPQNNRHWRVNWSFGSDQFVYACLIHPQDNC